MPMKRKVTIDVKESVESGKGNTTKVRNIKKYLMAALFNAPSTMSGYYQAEVNHDMPQFSKGNWQVG